MIMLPMLVVNKTLFLLEGELPEFITMYAATDIAATATRTPAISIDFLLRLDLCIRRRCGDIVPVSAIVKFKFFNAH
jgi:hypothetical protein